MSIAREANACVKHLNPRQGITNRVVAVPDAGERRCVKHLNPRQGITTRATPILCTSSSPSRCVKHLNPRQGITTAGVAVSRNDACR